MLGGEKTLREKAVAGEPMQGTALNRWSKEDGFQEVLKVSHGMIRLRLRGRMEQGCEKAEVRTQAITEGNREGGLVCLPANKAPP